MTVIKGAYASCRFLSAPQGEGGEFTSFLNRVGLDGQAGRPLRELVRLGWIKPRMRIVIPRTFILCWANFPTYPRHGTFKPEDDWAARVWSLATLPLSAAESASGWYRHPLDCDEFLVEMRRHLINSGPGCPEPETVHHPRGRGREVFPWIDFFGYWQAYRLFETLNAIKIMAPPENTLDLEDNISRLPDQLHLPREITDAQLERIDREWGVREPVFDWVSRFRILLGLSLQWDEDSSGSTIQAGAKALADDLGLTADAIREGIREVLLVMWADWARVDKGIPLAMRRHLQQDIYRAVEFHNLLAKDQIDPYDAYWNPPDRQSRRWARLKKALPFEKDRARAEFPRMALMYLNRFNAVVAAHQVLTEEKIREITEYWWGRGGLFRRFVLAFDRLHQHYSGSINGDNDVELIEQTPADFLVLTALHAEKLLVEQKAVARPKEAASGTSKLLKYWAEIVAITYFGVKGDGIESFRRRIKERLENETALHDLSLKPKNPFVDLNGAADGLSFFENAIINTMILRNYSAHHSCLDFELTHGPWVKDPLESIIVVVLTVLQTAPLDQ